jgi:hypothetical protein
MMMPFRRNGPHRITFSLFVANDRPILSDVSASNGIHKSRIATETKFYYFMAMWDLPSSIGRVRV